jgi:hypothetical protein
MERDSRVKAWARELILIFQAGEEMQSTRMGLDKGIMVIENLRSNKLELFWRELLRRRDGNITRGMS